MIYVHCEQGSDAWHKARAGLITASMFAVARSRTGDLDAKQKVYVDAIRSGKPEKTAQALAGYSKAPTSKSVERAIEGLPIGAPSEAALNYAFRLAVERIGGSPLDEGFETWAMNRGHELEPEARRRHEIETGQTVQRIGFVMTDDERFGASLDGIIGEDGAAEYKCFVSPEKLRAIHIDGEIGDVREQAQGGLWVTGRRWIDVVCYCPALSACGRDLWRQRFERDEDFIEAMEADLVAFMRIVDQYEAALRLPLAA